MFAKTRKEKIVDDARALAHDLGEAIAPHVDKARDELAPRVAEAREQLSPRIAEARDAVAPHVENARNKFATEVAPAVAKAMSDAKEATGEARKRGELAAAALKGEDVQKKGRKGKLLVFLGVLGLGAVAAKKMLGSDDSANWQSSYTPSPAPAPAPAPPSPSAPMAGSHLADSAADTGAAGTAAGADDASGATPGETLSDAAETPHPVTTPDAPAEDVQVDPPKKGKSGS